MVTTRFFITFTLLAIFTLLLNAQEIEVISSGQGKTEEEATRIALRNALEDSYGTFISSSSIISNDILVSDEIISLVQGNIKKYKILNSNQLPDMQIYVTVKSIVALNKLSDFCQSNGMNIKFEVKMTKKAMFDFMLYTSYTSLSGIVGVIFGGVTLVLGIRQCMFGSYSTAATFFLFAAIFLIGNPLHLKARAAEQVMRSPMFQKPISYELNEEGIRISQDEQSVLNEWGDFRKAVSTGQSVIIYVTKVRALIFPRESLGEQYAAAVQMISTHMPAKKVNIRHVSAN